jgi:hypothetical protein
MQVRFGEEVCHGVLEGVMPSGDPRAPGLRAQVLIDNPDRRHQPGAIAVVEIPRSGAQTPVISLPKEAIIERGQLTGTFVVGADSIARLRWLVLGDTKNGLVMVLSGLHEGDRVVLSPPLELADGRLVKGESR